MTSILTEVESLRDKKTTVEIEQLLLNEELGEIGVSSNGYQYVDDLAVSHLVIEIHNPGFLEWMRNHPNKYVVHHIDSNPLNNVYLNLQVMKRSEHSRIHAVTYHSDPKNVEAKKDTAKAISKARIAYFADPANAEKVSIATTAYYANPDNAEDIEARYKKVSDWYKDPANAESLKARSKALSIVSVAYNADPANAEDIKAKGKAVSKTKRKSWPVLTRFTKPFTIREYAAVSEVSIDTARYRLERLIFEKLVIRGKKLIDSGWCNVYSRK